MLDMAPSCVFTIRIVSNGLSLFRLSGVRVAPYPLQWHYGKNEYGCPLRYYYEALYDYEY